jgi:predicted metal-dependent phosphoesterase TrpH
MIDLHIHTNYSDGKYSVIEVLMAATMKGLKYISITDHDTVKAYDELKDINVSDYYSGTIIPGVEIKVIYKGIPIEVLGYNIDIEKIKLDSWFQTDKKHSTQLRQFNHLKEVCKGVGLKLDSNLTLSDNEWAAYKIYEELIKYPENKDKLKELNISDTDFYRNHVCNKADIFYYEETDSGVSLEYASKLIRDAGGLVFLAHPLGTYIVPNPKALVEEIIETGLIDGLECMHSDINQEDSEYLRALCIQYDLYQSGGSDFHDFTRPIGTVNHGEETIPEHLINDWIKCKSKSI